MIFFSSLKFCVYINIPQCLSFYHEYFSLDYYAITTTTGAKRQRKVIDVENEYELTATESTTTVQEECVKVTPSDQQNISPNLAVSQEAGNLVKIQENSQDFDEILMSPKNGNRDQGTYHCNTVT